MNIIVTVAGFTALILVADTTRYQAQSAEHAIPVRAKIFCRSDSVETGYLLSADSDTIRLQTTLGLKTYHLSELKRVVIPVNSFDNSFGFTGALIGAVGGALLLNLIYEPERIPESNPNRNKTFLYNDGFLLGGWAMCIPSSVIGMVIDDYTQRDGNTIIVDCTGDSISLSGKGAEIRRFLNGEDPAYRRWRLDATAGYVFCDKSARISKSQSSLFGTGNISYLTSNFNALRTLGLHYRVTPKFECGLIYVKLDEPTLYRYAQDSTGTHEIQDDIRNTGVAVAGNYRLLAGDGLTGGQWFECVAGAAIGISAFDKHNVLKTLTKSSSGYNYKLVVEDSDVSRTLPFAMGSLQFSIPLARAIRFGLYADYALSLPVTLSNSPSSGIQPATITVGNACVGLSVGARF